MAPPSSEHLRHREQIHLRNAPPEGKWRGAVSTNLDFCKRLWPIFSGTLFELQLEAAFVALDRNHPQQWGKLLLILGRDAHSRVELRVCAIGP